MKEFSLNLGGKLVRHTRPAVMGILNVTPDSFYAGSRTQTDEEIRQAVNRMAAEGVDIIDVGGCSTRPGSTPPSEAEERERVVRACHILRELEPDVPVSVDTYRASVARAAAEEGGAVMVNDVSGGRDPDMWPLVADLGVAYVLMHSRGTPRDMQLKTDYRDVTADVITELSGAVRQLSLMGVADVVIDPGFGFAKTLDQNYELMRNLPLLAEAFPGRPLLVGVSRKSMLTKLLDIPATDALAATVALQSFAIGLGAQILRVHDVRQAVQASRLAQKLFGYK